MPGRKKSTGRRRSKGRQRSSGCVPAKRTVKVPRLLTKRRSLPAAAFALPEERRYPIPDEYHATLALSFLVRTAGRHGPRPEEARKVLSAVRHYWPGVYRCEADLVAEAKRRNKVKLVPTFRGPSKAKFRRASKGLKRKVSRGRVKKTYKRSKGRSRGRR